MLSPSPVVQRQNEQRNGNQNKTNFPCFFSMVFIYNLTLDREKNIAYKSQPISPFLSSLSWY